MARFLVHYSTGEYGKAWFDADSLDHAEALLEEVRNGEMSFDDLPFLNAKSNGDELELSGLRELQ